jgi:glycosyltransferase involved in cell wall biosynthesis
VIEIQPLVSINVCIRNEEQYIRSCLNSLLNQTFKNFEIIIVDDASTDSSSNIINEFHDKRIKYFKNKRNKGIAKSRNTAIKRSSGKYIFCTDGDCTVNNTWIAEGIKSFQNGCLGVEGKLIYVSENYKPTFSTKFMENREGGHYMTGNVAYRRDILNGIGGFNEEINWFRDRDLGLTVAKLGKLCFNKKMIAIHPQVIQTPKSLISSASRIEGRVYLFKKFKDRVSMTWRIINPFNLAKILFPELIVLELFFFDFKTREDFELLPYTYIFAILERLHVWKARAKNRVFLI